MFKLEKDCPMNKERLFKIILTVLFFCVFIFVIVKYITFYSFTEMNSDTMDSMLWSLATWKGGSLLNSDFYYPCLLSFGGNIIFLPFIAIWGFSAMTYKAGMILFAILLFTCLYFFLYSLDCTYSARIFLLSVFACFSIASETLRQFLWTHILYYNLGLILLLFALASLNMLLKTGKKIWCVLLGLAMIIATLNGFTEISLVVLPVMAALCLNIFMDFQQPIFEKKNKQYLAPIGILICSTVVGGVLTKLVTNGIQSMGYDEGFARFSDVSTWVENLQRLSIDWMNLFGVYSVSNVNFFSADGIRTGWAIVISLIVFILPVICTVQYMKFAIEFKMLLWSYWTVAGISLLGYICGYLGECNRRLVPMVCLAFIIAMVYFIEEVKTVRIRNLSCAILILFGVLLCFRVKELEKNLDNINWLQQAADYVDERGYTRGYAPYFTANTLTMFTQKAVTVPINSVAASSQDDVEAWGTFRYNTFESWIEDNEQNGAQFIVLSVTEYGNLGEKKKPVIDNASGVVELGPYFVFTYDDGVVIE